MKIAIAINTSWNIYNFRRGLVSHFISRGDEVVAIAPRDDYSPMLEALGCRFVPLEMSASGMNPITDLKLLFRFYAVLKRERPDVLLSFTIKPNIYGSIAAGLLKIPVICNVSGLGTVFLWKGRVKQVATLLYQLAFRNTSWIFFQNDEDREEFFRFVRIDLQKTSLLPGSGVDINYFHPGEQHLNDEPVFLLVARLIVEKGVREYINAIRILKKKGRKETFRLVGGLDESHARSIDQSELSSWVEEGLIHYTEHAQDIRSIMSEADVVVLPSYREGTPRTLLEAGAMGKPLIATDVPGCRHVVADGRNGFLCKPKSAEDLAAKMMLFLALSQSEKMEMGRNSRELIEQKFDERLVIRLYEQKIDDLVRSV